MGNHGAADKSVNEAGKTFMNKKIENVIADIYVKRDKTFFVSCCCKELGFISNLVNAVKEKCQNIITGNSAGEPSSDITFQLKEFTNRIYLCLKIVSLENR